MAKLIGTSQDDSSKYMRLLIAGRPKTGKTLLAASFPAPLFINTDRGMAVLAKRGLKIPAITFTRMTLESKNEELNGWLDLHEILTNIIGHKGRYWDEIKAMKPMPQTLVIDSLSALSELFEAEVLTKPVIKDKKPGEQWLDLKDYGVIQNRLFSLISLAKDMPMNFVCTTGVKTVKDEDSGRILEIPALTGTAIGERVAHQFDDVILLYTEDGKDKKPEYYATPLPTRQAPYVGRRTIDLDGPVRDPTYTKLVKKGVK